MKDIMKDDKCGETRDKIQEHNSVEELKDKIIESLKEVYDPEIPVNIYDLGLIYNIEIIEGTVNLLMTLTSPNCPVAEELPIMAQDAVIAVPGVEKANVEITWDPPWTPDMMPEEMRFAMGQGMDAYGTIDPFGMQMGQFNLDDIDFGKSNDKEST